MTGSRFSTIAADLRERIALGDLGSSGAIESEAELCARYAVSRPTVRRALETLRDEGLVEARQGAGWFLVGAAFHQRLALGTFTHAGSAVREAGARVAREVTDFGFRDAPPTVAAALRLPAPGAQDPIRVLHVRSVRRTAPHAGLDVTTEWVPAELAGPVSRDDAADPGLWASLAARGTRVASVRQTITAGLATDDDAHQLGTTAGAPLLLVRRLALDPSGTPIALADHRYLASRFALEVDFHSGPATTTDETPGLRAVNNTEGEPS